MENRTPASSDERLVDLLRKTVAGETGHLSALAHAGNKVLGEVNAHITPPLTLTTRALATVLRGMLSGDHSPEQARQWASFVSYGYFAEPGRPVRPLDFEWDEAAEEPIAHTLMRLNEIGDLIDGEVSTEEIHQLLAALGN